MATIRDLLNIALQRTATGRLHKEENLEKFCDYLLENEWYTTIDELKLALSDVQAWSDLKLPGRLKLEMKAILLDNAASSYSQSVDTEVSWTRCWSEEHNSFYFFNHVTSEARWSPPDGEYEEDESVFSSPEYIFATDLVKTDLVEMVRRLTEMGFSEDVAIDALAKYDNDLGAAAGFLVLQLQRSQAVQLKSQDCPDERQITIDTTIVAGMIASEQRIDVDGTISCEPRKPQSVVQVLQSKSNVPQKPIFLGSTVNQGWTMSRPPAYVNDTNIST